MLAIQKQPRPAPTESFPYPVPFQCYKMECDIQVLLIVFSQITTLYFRILALPSQEHPGHSLIMVRSPILMCKVLYLEHDFEINRNID